MVLSLLAVFGPISMDLYLPVLPALTGDLGTTTSAAQLTITACLLGLAGGQLVAGPLSDRFGRRGPLLIGVTLFVLSCLLCAVCPTIEVLILVRFVQGLAGSVGIVIAQAAGRDLYTGGRLVRYYGRLTVLAGLAAIVGPLIGGQLAAVTDWRGTFVFLAGVGLIILLGCLIIFRETLPPERRMAGGLRATIRNFGRLLADRAFVCVVLITGFLNAAIFAYLSGATFILQGLYGLSPQQYSFAFGLNSLGFMVLGFLSGRLAARWTERRVLLAGLIMSLLGAAGLLTTGTAQLPLPAMIGSLFLLVGGVALTTAPATSLALANYPNLAGTASSLVGLTRYGLGGLAAPLVGIAGAGTAVPLGLVATLATAAAVVIFLRYTFLVRVPFR